MKSKQKSKKRIGLELTLLKELPKEVDGRLLSQYGVLERQLTEDPNAGNALLAQVTKNFGNQYDEDAKISDAESAIVFAELMVSFIVNSNSISDDAKKVVKDLFKQAKDLLQQAQAKNNNEAVWENEQDASDSKELAQEAADLADQAFLAGVDMLKEILKQNAPVEQSSATQAETVVIPKQKVLPPRTQKIIDARLEIEKITLDQGIQGLEETVQKLKKAIAESGSNSKLDVYNIIDKIMGEDQDAATVIDEFAGYEDLWSGDSKLDNMEIVPTLRVLEKKRTELKVQVEPKNAITPDAQQSVPVLEKVPESEPTNAETQLQDTTPLAEGKPAAAAEQNTAEEKKPTLVNTEDVSSMRRADQAATPEESVTTVGAYLDPAKTIGGQQEANANFTPPSLTKETPAAAAEQNAPEEEILPASSTEKEQMMQADRSGLLIDEAPKTKLTLETIPEEQDVSQEEQDVSPRFEKSTLEWAIDDYKSALESAEQKLEPNDKGTVTDKINQLLLEQENYDFGIVKNLIKNYLNANKSENDKNVDDKSIDTLTREQVIDVLAKSGNVTLVVGNKTIGVKKNPDLSIAGLREDFLTKHGVVEDADEKITVIVHKKPSDQQLEKPAALQEQVQVVGQKKGVTLTARKKTNKKEAPPQAGQEIRSTGWLASIAAVFSRFSGRKAAPKSSTVVPINKNEPKPAPVNKTTIPDRPKRNGSGRFSKWIRWALQPQEPPFPITPPPDPKVEEKINIVINYLYALQRCSTDADGKRLIAEVLAGWGCEKGDINDYVRGNIEQIINMLDLTAPPTKESIISAMARKDKIQIHLQNEDGTFVKKGTEIGAEKYPYFLAVEDYKLSIILPKGICDGKIMHMNNAQAFTRKQITTEATSKRNAAAGLVDMQCKAIKQYIDALKEAAKSSDQELQSTAISALNEWSRVVPGMQPAEIRNVLYSLTAEEKEIKSRAQTPDGIRDLIDRYLDDPRMVLGQMAKVNGVGWYDLKTKQFFDFKPEHGDLMMYSDDISNNTGIAFAKASDKDLLLDKAKFVRQQPSKAPGGLFSSNNINSPYTFAAHKQFMLGNYGKKSNKGSSYYAEESERVLVYKERHNGQVLLREVPTHNGTYEVKFANANVRSLGAGLNNANNAAERAGGATLHFDQMTDQNVANFVQAYKEVFAQRAVSNKMYLDIAFTTESGKVVAEYLIKQGLDNQSMMPGAAEKLYTAVGLNYNDVVVNAPSTAAPAATPTKIQISQNLTSEEEQKRIQSVNEMAERARNKGVAGVHQYKPPRAD